MNKENYSNLLKSLEETTSGLHLPASATVCFVRVESANLEMLPPTIQKCAPRRQNSFAAGRHAAKNALRCAEFSGSTDLAIGQDGLPLWPVGWTGSISHTDDIAAAIVAPEEGLLLGIDIEQIIPNETALQIAPKVAPELLPPTPGAPFEEQITRAFSAKEALYKALYSKCREFKNFSAARFSWKSNAGSSLPLTQLTLTESWHADYPKETVLNVAQVVVENYVVSIVWDQTTPTAYS